LNTVGIFTLLAQRHGWGPEQVGKLTRYQASAYLLGYGSDEPAPMSQEETMRWLEQRLKDKHQ